MAGIAACTDHLITEHLNIQALTFDEVRVDLIEYCAAEPHGVDLSTGHLISGAKFCHLSLVFLLF